MKKIILYTLLLLFVGGASAQKIVKGTVKDEKGTALAGATICLTDDITVGTTADTDGAFVLKIKSDYKGKIQASYVGYTTQYKDITDKKQQNIAFTLKEDVKYLDQVVVTGTRTPKLLSEAPIQTRLITSEDIEKTDAANITDLLQQEMPGSEFSYAMNQQVNMNMAGFFGQSVLFLIDGERLSGETMDNVDFQRLDMNNVERIEIVKGAASALYGSSAAGGVINIITKDKMTKPVSVGLSARYGSHNNQMYSANIGLNKGMFHNMLSVNYTGIDTYTVDYNKDNDFNQVFGGNTWNFKDKLILTPSDDLKFTAKAGYFFRERLYNTDIPDRYRDFNGGLRGNWTINDRSDMELSYNFDQYDKSDYIKAKDLDIRDYSNVQNSVRALYNYSFSKTDQDRLLTFGADYMHDYLDSYQFSDGYKSQNTADVFAQYDWNLNKYWEIVGALRYDWFSDGNNSNLTEKVTIRWHKDAFTVRLGYGGGFRAPSLKEKYMNYDMANIFYIRGNKDLKNEKSHNFNISGEYTHGSFNYTASAYYNLVQNRITTSALKNDGDGTGNYVQYMNIDDINVYGGEITAQCRLPLGLNAKVCYSYTKEEIKQMGTLNPYAPARPHSLVFRMDYDRQVSKDYGFNILFSGRYLSSVDSEKFNTQDNTSVNVTYPAYTLWKLSFTQRIMKKIRISAALDNLFNYIPSPYYFNSPTTSGRTFYIDVSVNL
ncbi:MAG: TonB-dependent receptor [Bacteroidales bacterium]|nr:TonB-dependent receptor [Bacteroidales bacterium]